MTWADWLYPRQCLGCGNFGNYICADCLNKLKVTSNLICPECLKPSWGGLTHPKCRHWAGMEGLLSVLEYGGLAEKLVRTYKYRFVEALTDDLVEIMTSMADWERLSKHCWLVYGVPLHTKRQRWRGFNQAEKLAQGIADYAGWELNNRLLIRQKQTKPQMSLGRAERLKNLDGVFADGEEIEKVKNREILLIDDVWTTGTTMRECARVLKLAGAKTVWGLTLARAV